MTIDLKGESAKRLDYDAVGLRSDGSLLNRAGYKAFQIVNPTKLDESFPGCHRSTDPHTLWPRLGWPDWAETRRRKGEGFDAWLDASLNMKFIDCGALLQRATQARELTDAEVDAYRAPFPDETYMAGARQFPPLVPITPNHPSIAENNKAWAVLDQWDKPFLTLWCPDDPVLGNLHHELIERVPGAAGQPHREFSPGGHFIQDDRGEDLAAALLAWER